MNRNRLIVLAAGLLVSSAAFAQDDQKSVDVYYQVTYSNGQIKDLSQPPDTNQGIRMVVKIERYDTGESKTVISTDPEKPVMTKVNPAKTITTTLAWDGKAWTDPRLAAKAGQAGSVGGAGLSGPASVYYQVTYSDGKIEDLNSAPQTKEGITRVVRLTRYEEDTPGSTVISTDPEKPVMTRINPGKTTSVSMIWKNGAWVAPAEAIGAPNKGSGSSSALPAPSGQVKLLDGPPEKTAGTATLANPENKQKDNSAPADGGIIKPLESAKVMPHRMQVWKLAPAEGKRVISVSMAHSEAGPLGAFYYVACVDSDGDGVPDKIIARSDIVEAQKPGQWSNWTFASAEPVVFVGNAWPYETTSIFIGAPPPAPVGGKPQPQQQDNWQGNAVGVEAYVSGALWDPKFRKWCPILTNIRIHTEDQDQNQKKYDGLPVKIEQPK